MNQAGQRRSGFADRVAAALFSFYKGAIGPVLHAAGGACRFQPTCSEYAAIAVAEYGLLRGGFMALGRLLRCHPLHRGGFDPVRARLSDASGSRTTQISQQISPR